MIRNLEQNGYLTRTPDGTYRLTDLGLSAIQRPVPVPKKENAAVPRITMYDQKLLEIVDGSNAVVPALLSKHPNGQSLAKRVETLKKQKLITEDNILIAPLLTRLELQKTRCNRPIA